MDKFHEALRVLGLTPSATPAEIKQTYRDLAKVWHPDRFANDPRLRRFVEEKLKEINGAYDLLSDWAPTVPRRPVPPPSYPRDSQPPNGKSPTPPPPGGGMDPSFYEPPAATPSRVGKRMAQFGLLLSQVVLLIVFEAPPWVYITVVIGALLFIVNFE